MTAANVAERGNMGRSVGAFFAGFVSVFVLSLAVDQVLHVLKIYPPWGQPMFEPGLNVLALSYRLVITVFGAWLTARLAPRNPMKHAIVLGSIGTVFAAVGAVGAAMMDPRLGPLWYPILLAATGLPCAWLGGWLVSRRRAA